MKKFYNEINVCVWNFDKDVTTELIFASGEAFDSGDGTADDDFIE